MSKQKHKKQVFEPSIGKGTKRVYKRKLQVLVPWTEFPEPGVTTYKAADVLPAVDTKFIVKEVTITVAAEDDIVIEQTWGHVLQGTLTPWG